MRYHYHQTNILFQHFSILYNTNAIVKTTASVIVTISTNVSCRYFCVLYIAIVTVNIAAGMTIKDLFALQWPRCLYFNYINNNVSAIIASTIPGSLFALEKHWP